MRTRTGAARRWASWRWTRRTLTSAFCAAGVAAVLVTAAPPALADPEQDPGNPAPPAPVVEVPAPDPLAAPAPAPADPLAPPADPLAPPADPLAPPADPLAPPADPLAAPVDPLAPPVDPLAPPAAAQPAATAATGVAGQNPEPFTGEPPFRPPTFNPLNGSMVGVAKPIMINFAVPITDRGLAEQAIHISSNPPVPGKFYWLTDTQVRWRPLDFWPANTTVNIDAAGAKSSFRTGDSLVATIDDTTHQMTITRNGKVEKTFPVSMGKPSHVTPNGKYYVLEKFADMTMDSSTYGVPVNSAEGYKVKVQDAVRIDNHGTFVHSAPWSVSDQGKRNVSHGCINISPANAQWFYDNFGSGDAIVVKNSVGTYTKPDGANDWQI